MPSTADVPELRSRYDALCAARGPVVVNTWGVW
jgi:hypothetical protein